MPSTAALPFVFRGVDIEWRQLGDANRSTAAEETKRAGKAGAVGRWGVENRDGRDPLAAKFEIGRDRVEAVERKFLEKRLATKCSSFVRQPLSAGFVAGGGRPARPTPSTSASRGPPASSASRRQSADSL